MKKMTEDEIKYRTLFESSRDAIMILAPPDWLFTAGNPATIEMFKAKDEKQFTAKGPWELSPEYQPDGQLSSEKARKMIEKAMKTGSHFFEWTHKRFDGKEFPTTVLLTRIELKGKKLLQATVRDVTERIRAEEELEKYHDHLEEMVEEQTIELRESKERFRSLYENVTVGMYRTTPKGQIVMANPALISLLGYDSFEELKKRNLEESGFEPEYTREKFIEEIKKNGKVQGLESKWKRRDGTSVFIRESTRAVKDERGNIIYYDGIVEDITERKKAEEKTKASLKEKEVLLREIHHRVKNNMQIVISLLRLQSARAEDKKTQEIFRECQNRIHTMALIHDKLYQSKDLARINFAQYIDGLAVHTFHSYGVDSNIIALKTDLEGVFLDLNRAIPCGLIINELLSNSIKHSFPQEKKGEILVKLHSDKKGTITLVVSDNGIGFPKDLDFRKASSLGLQMVNDLTKQIGGTIELDRTGGTAFKVEFPVNK